MEIETVAYTEIEKRRTLFDVRRYVSLVLLVLLARHEVLGL